jgi:2-iminobutanoate/2-iminopropanoate deaminase
MKQIIQTEEAPQAIGPYSQGIKAGGSVYTSGQLGIDPATNELADGVEAQTHASMKNIGSILTKLNLGYADIVKTTIYVQNMDDFGTVNLVYESYFTGEYPARSCVEVAKLPKGGLVEIECIAIG